MENNSDKQMRDKLKGLELPYDPQAWEQMEAMLDKKKKNAAALFGGGLAVQQLCWC